MGLRPSNGSVAAGLSDPCGDMGVTTRLGPSLLVELRRGHLQLHSGKSWFSLIIHDIGIFTIDGHGNSDIDQTSHGSSSASHDRLSRGPSK